MHRRAAALKVLRGAPLELRRMAVWSITRQGSAQENIAALLDPIVCREVHTPGSKPAVGVRLFTKVDGFFNFYLCPVCLKKT